MKTAAPYARAVAVATPARPMIPQDEPSAPASRVTIETRGGLVWVKGPDGIEQPCSSPRVAALVAASVRNLTAA